MKIKNDSIKIAVAISLVMVLVLGGLYVYNRSLQESLGEATLKTLDEVFMQQKNTLVAKMEGENDAIAAIALTLSNRGGAYQEKEWLLPFMQEVVESSGFQTILVVNDKGVGLNDTGEVVNIADQDFFRQVLGGEGAISYVAKQDNLAQKSIIFAAPIVDQGRVMGVIAGVYDNAVFTELINPIFYEKGLINIADGNGDLVIRIRGEDGPPDSFMEANFYAVFNSENVTDEHDGFGLMVEKISSGQCGYTKAMINGEKQLVHYEPVGINDWYIFSVISQDIMASESGAITKNALLLTGMMAIVICALVIFLTRAQKRYANQLYQIAYYDELTGAPNLPKFKLEAEKLLKSRTDEQYFFIRMDVSNFKVINEIYGIEAGDEVIKTIASLMTEMVQRPKCAFGRVHADEFVIIDTLETMEDINARRQFFEKTFSQMNIKARYHKFEFRYGQYVVEPGETDVNLILEKINLAHRMARIKKSNEICSYDEAVKNALVKEAEIENKMDLALKNDEFKLYLQPKYSLLDERMTGAEALVRWQKADGKIISPMDFIPLFERNGFVTQVDLYLFEKVCQLLRSWLDQGLDILTVSVNFSRLHLENPNFVREIGEIAERYQVPKHFLEVELTESTMFDNEVVLEMVLEKLHQAGFTLSMDDFGTGYSSLGLLKNLPVDVIKIDRSFFANTKHKTRTRIVLGNILKMARELGIQTVAEGVETSEHISFLQELKCDMVQGYYYAKPIPAEDLDLLNRQATPTEIFIKKTFDADSLGDISFGRGTLGDEMLVSVYRLFQFTLREVLIDTYGEGEMVDIFRKAGVLAGGSFVKEMLDTEQPLTEFLGELAKCLLEYKIGQIKLETYDEATGQMTLVVSNDLDCSGVQATGKTLCQYDEGFIQGILDEYTKQSYSVIEVDCWGTGADVCRFEVRPK